MPLNRGNLAFSWIPLLVLLEVVLTNACALTCRFLCRFPPHPQAPHPLPLFPHSLQENPPPLKPTPDPLPRDTTRNLQCFAQTTPGKKKLPLHFCPSFCNTRGIHQLRNRRYFEPATIHASQCQFVLGRLPTEQVFGGVSLKLR